MYAPMSYVLHGSVPTYGIGMWYTICVCDGGEQRVASTESFDVIVFCSHLFFDKTEAESSSLFYRNLRFLLSFSRSVRTVRFVVDV